MWIMLKLGWHVPKFTKIYINTMPSSGTTLVSCKNYQANASDTTLGSCAKQFGQALVTLLWWYVQSYWTNACVLSNNACFLNIACVLSNNELQAYLQDFWFYKKLWPLIMANKGENTVILTECYYLV